MVKAKKPAKPPRSLGAKKQAIPFRDVVQKLLETGPMQGEPKPVTAHRRSRKS